MAELELDAIEARANAAIEGPWRAFTTGPAGGDHWYVAPRRTPEYIALIHANDGVDEEQRGPDAEFIAHARTDIPALVAEVRRLLVEVDRLHNLLDGYRGALAETEADRDLFRSAAGWGELP